jgi:hypothetical protein
LIRRIGIGNSGQNRIQIKLSNHRSNGNRRGTLIGCEAVGNLESGGLFISTNEEERYESYRTVKPNEYMACLMGDIMSEKLANISDKIRVRLGMQSLDNKLLSRVYGTGRGSVFTQDGFLDLGSRAAVDKSLSRLAQKGTLNRLARGVYYYPKVHPDLGELSPEPDRVARAVAGKLATRLLPSGAYAANLLGLSEQVPAKIVFLTDGPSRIIRIGKQEIRLRRTSLRNMAAAGRLSGLLIQAFRYLGKEHITQERIRHLKRTIPANERRRLLKDLRLAPAWMHPLLRTLVGGGS